MKKIGLCLLLFSFVACQSEKKTTNAADSTDLANGADPYSFTYDSVKVYAKKPVSRNPATTDTTKAVIVYPQFKDQKTNDFVLQKTLATALPDKQYKSYQAYANGFIQDYETFIAREKEYGQTWFLEIKNKVAAQKKNYLSVLSTFVSYEGGAHPNTMLSYLNYDPQTHKEILLDSLIQPGSMSKLTAEAEKIFRKNEKLTPTANLGDNYFFKDNKFSLNNNFTVTEEGIKFLYNPYEIKAYVFGITELTVPFSTLKEIARPHSLLSPDH